MTKECNVGLLPVANRLRGRSTPIPNSVFYLNTSDFVLFSLSIKTDVKR